jgi:hypothetical protein
MKRRRNPGKDEERELLQKKKVLGKTDRVDKGVKEDEDGNKQVEEYNVKEGIRTRQELKDDAIAQLNSNRLTNFDHSRIRPDCFMVVIVSI